MCVHRQPCIISVILSLYDALFFPENKRRLFVNIGYRRGVPPANYSNLHNAIFTARFHHPGPKRHCNNHSTVCFGVNINYLLSKISFVVQFTLTHTICIGISLFWLEICRTYVSTCTFVMNRYLGLRRVTRNDHTSHVTYCTALGWWVSIKSYSNLSPSLKQTWRSQKSSRRVPQHTRGKLLLIPALQTKSALLSPSHSGIVKCQGIVSGGMSIIQLRRKKISRRRTDIISSLCDMTYDSSYTPRCGAVRQSSGRLTSKYMRQIRKTRIRHLSCCDSMRLTAALHLIYCVALDYVWSIVTATSSCTPHRHIYTLLSLSFYLLN